MPRTRATIGRYVTALDLLLAAHPADDALMGRVEWLGARVVVGDEDLRLGPDQS